MQIEAYLNGIYPRSDLALEAGSKWLKGRETKDNFYKILEKETIEIIELQKSLGFDYIADGQLFWNDFLRPIASALGLHSKNNNADENPVTRQIYTNTFYRKPLISKRINGFEGSIVDRKFINIIPRGKRKVILPSPFAFAYLSDGIHKNSDGTLRKDYFVEVLFDLAKILNQELRNLEKDSNISFVQFNEPCMLYAEETTELWDEIVDSLKIASQNLDIASSLHLYNGDASKFLQELPELPVDRIGMDAYSTNLIKFAGTEFDKFLELGVINSKNSLVENPDALVKYANQIIEKINPAGLALVPNRPLELVPEAIAKQKIKSLAKARELLGAK